MRIWAFSVSLLCTLLVVGLMISLVQLYRVNNWNTYHKNRQIEHEFLADIINSSHGSLAEMKEQWGEKLRFLEPRECYVIDISTVFTSDFFIRNEYVLEASEHWRYYFKFDDNGKLTEVNLSKP